MKLLNIKSYNKLTELTNIFKNKKTTPFKENKKYSPKELYALALKANPKDLHLYAQAMIETGDSYYNYLFAKNIKGADILAHGNVVIKDGLKYLCYVDEYNYLFARDIPGADVLSHGKVILKGKGAYYNYLFARDVKGADVLSHGKVILNDRDAYYNYLFARDVKGADIKSHSHCVKMYGNGKVNYYFAKDIKEADAKSHSQSVVLKQDYEFMLKFAQDIPNADIDLIYQAIQKSGNQYYIREMEKLPNVKKVIKNNSKQKEKVL